MGWYSLRNFPFLLWFLYTDPISYIYITREVIMDYSPILSIVTAVLEISAAAWALLSKGRRSVRYSAAAVLFFLASYQIMEASICADPVRFTRLVRPAFMTVLWLPATGLLLLTFLAPTLRRFMKIYTGIFYALALGIFIWQFVDQTPVGTSVCLVVFARYNNVMPRALTLAYGIYYQLGLLSMLVLSAVGVVKTADAFARKQIGQLLFGCLIFIIPAMMVTRLIPLTEGAYASILCHMAILLAVFIFSILWLENKKN